MMKSVEDPEMNGKIDWGYAWKELIFPLGYWLVWIPIVWTIIAVLTWG